MNHLLPLLLVTTVQAEQIAQQDQNAQTNISDVIITYAGHVDAFHPVPDRTTTHPTQLVPERTTTNTTQRARTTSQVDEPEGGVAFEYPTEEDGVLFIPHEQQEVARVENEFYRTPMRISDIIEKNKKSVADVMSDTNTVPLPHTTESINGDILFISGKNAEKEETEYPETKYRGAKHMDMDFRRRGSGEKIIQKKLDCKNLNCNNNMKSVCGGKKENGRYKYRLFLNECYYRKVNCAFVYEENRYKVVPQMRCDSVAVHLVSRPTTTPIIPLPVPKNLTKWKSYSSRRTMNLDANGRFCSHPCPASCPEEYDPECAVSKSGKRRMFINHCKLDYDSCFYGEIWQRRPLAECVGPQKADLQHNRRFIGWMQRAGIVDKKGRLSI